MTDLVLASASPARLATLRAAGIEPHVAVSAVDEPAVLAAAAQETPGGLAPADAVLLLARAKARDVASTHPGSLVLGCDSMLELDGEVLGKPTDADDAAARWRAMRGRTGRLHTGHWLVDHRAPGEDGADPERGTVHVEAVEGRLDASTGGHAEDKVGLLTSVSTASTVDVPQPVSTEVGATSTTIVHFADVTDDEIAAYVATGEPLWVAGAFTIDGLGGPFITGIEGDHHGVVGLSLPLLRTLLAERSVPITTLWHRPPA